MKAKSLPLAALLCVSTICIPALAAGQSKISSPGDVPKDLKLDPVQSMRGYVSTTTQQDEIAGCIDEALSTAITRSIEAQKNTKQVSKYSRAALRAWKATTSTVNFMLDDRGFLPSIEGGQLMLDENLKVHDKPSAECAKQMWLDRTHDKVVADIVELVTGLGTSDPARHQELISDAMQSLKSYDGDETAARIYNRLAAWSDREQTECNPSAFPSNGQWTVKERQYKVSMIVGTVSKNDPIVAEVKKGVHKYSKKSKLTVKSSQVISTSLNVCSLTPTLIGPAAQAALLILSLGTGGFEEDKLLTEMYLGKRYQSRENSFHNQALIALDAYQFAMQTHNAPLASCSASLVKRLGGEDLWKSVCQNVPLASPPSPDSSSQTALVPGKASAPAPSADPGASPPESEHSK